MFSLCEKMITRQDVAKGTTKQQNDHVARVDEHYSTVDRRVPAHAEKFSRFHALADKSGVAAQGRELFSKTCQSCHSVAGQGGQVGPVLNGAGALGVESLLRNILTPNAAMEPGYRVFRVELKDGDVLDGIRVSEDRDAIILRRPNVDDLRIPQSTVKRAAFTRTSMMPDGLLDALQPQEVSDLFAYLKTLR